MDVQVDEPDTFQLVDFNTVEKVILAKRVGRKLCIGCRAADRPALEGVARRLLGEDAEAIREALSFEVRRYEALPGDMARTLAFDSSDVATPFLEDSVVLDDEILIEIVRNGRDHAQIAIARRGEISEAVSTALAEQGSERANVMLCRNDGAKLNAETCARLVARFPDSPAVLGELAVREDLPPGARKMVDNHVSRHLSPAFIEHQGQTTFGAILIETREEQARGELTVDRIKGRTKAGGIEYLEAALVVLARLPRRNVAILLREAKGRGQRELFRRAHISDPDMKALLALANL